jgi:hypothetical protein
MAEKVDQSGASAQGDIVAGNKTEYHYHPGAEAGVIEKLLEKLQQEMEQKKQQASLIAESERYYARRAGDTEGGLDEKLSAVGRGGDYLDALEKKEKFVKLVERWSLYVTAQLIFVFLLARAEYRFTLFIEPKIGDLDAAHVSQLFDTHIVEPTVSECAASVFAFNHSTAMGMIYWLADQCFVRWTK